jgi:hypothetical protein
VWIKFLFRKLPTDAQALETIAAKLSVSLFGTSVTHSGHTGIATNEVQRRIMDHIRFRKDNALWLIALLAGLSSLASAIAAWLAVWHKG